MLVASLNNTHYPNVSRVLTGNVGAYLGSFELWDDDDTSADDRIGLANVYGNGDWNGRTFVADLHGANAHYTVSGTLQRIA